MRKMKCQFGIKYKTFKISDSRYILFPVGLLKGEETFNEGFITEKGKEYFSFNASTKNNYKYFVDMIYADDELAEIYGYPEDINDEDIDFLGGFFYEDYRDTILFVDLDNVDEIGRIIKDEINVKTINSEDPSAIYYMDNTIPNVVLNGKAMKEMIDCNSLKKVKLLLTKYQRGLNQIKKHKKMEGVTRISITDGKVNYYETTRDIDFRALESERNKSNRIVIPSENREISYTGLRDYIKERIYGHDEEIDVFAQKLYMNHTAKENEPIESILLVGPTGTGKTETVNVGCEYLDIPMYEVNASNLVPQGYKGTSIEDIIMCLYERAGGNLEKAQRGLVFLDEFDKLNTAESELKVEIKPILLTFTAGGNFLVDTGHYHFTFNTTMTNKLYAGVFEEISSNKKPIGFDTAGKHNFSLGTAEEIRKKIIDKKYFSQEELTRISTVLAYNDMPREVKKDILLNNKHGEYAKKRDRYKRQFGIDLILEKEYVEALLDKVADTTGMRSVNNLFKRTINKAETTILENEDKGYKRLVLTKETVLDPKNFDLSK